MNLVIKQLVYQNTDMLMGWGVGLFFCSLYVARVIHCKLSGWLALSYLYLTASGLNLAFNPYVKYAPDPFYYIPICYTALIGVLCLNLLTFIMLNLSKDALIALIHCIPLLSVLNAFYVILGAVFGFGWLPESSGYSGFLHYSGMNAVLISCGLPLLMKKTRYHLAAIGVCLIAVFLSFSSVPYGVIGVMLGAYCLKKRLFPKWKFWVAALAVLIGLLLVDHSLLNSGKRFDAYRIFMGAWWHFGNIWVGNGFGSFQAIQSTIQDNNNFMVGAYWSWLHSDILQSFWELGVVGGSLILVSLWHSIKRLYYSEHTGMFALACGLASSAVFDFPVRYFSLAALSAFVVCFAWRRDYFYAEECY